MTEHDVTRPTWGRNVSLLEWKPEDNHASGFCWLTPGPKDGDILLIQGKKSVIRLKLYDVRWMGNVDDMYSFKAVPPELPIPTGAAEE